MKTLKWMGSFLNRRMYTRIWIWWTILLLAILSSYSNLTHKCPTVKQERGTRILEINNKNPRFIGHKDIVFRNVDVILWERN